MKRIMSAVGLLAVAAGVFGLLCSSYTRAGKPPGAGNGDGGSAYTLVLLQPGGADLARGGAQDVDDAGNVAGWYETTSGERHAYCYDFADNACYTLAGGTLASGLNNAGEIVGQNDLAPAVIDAVYWGSAQAGPTTLEGLPGNTVSVARSINMAGIIAGVSLVDGTRYGVLWRTGDVQVAAVLPPLAGAPHAYASRISECNAAGVAHVVGYSSLTLPAAGQDGRATLWDVWIDDAGSLHVSDPVDLGVLAVGPSEAYGVNTAGDSCGRSDVWPVVKLDGQPMEPLPGTSKTIGGYAEDINEADDVVGLLELYPRCCVSFPRAWLWSAGRGTDLNDKVRLDRSEVLKAASAISNTGHIVGLGDFGQANAGYLLVPN